jgi:hypothetical protein
MERHPVFLSAPELFLAMRRLEIGLVFSVAREQTAYATSPALAVAGGCSIRALQGFVFDVGIGAGRKGPDFSDDLVHGLPRY